MLSTQTSRAPPCAQPARRSLPENFRLLPLVVSWLVAYGNFVARHRPKRLIESELEPDDRAAIGLIVGAAIDLGAPRDLALVLEPCRPVPPRPLSAARRGNPALETIALRHASPLSRRWGLWAPHVALRPDTLRPVAWILQHNPTYRGRIIRKGDLRSSILETLRHDAAGRARSESELARLSGATRAAVRKALGALVQEGEVRTSKEPGNNRDHPVTLTHAA